MKTIAYVPSRDELSLRLRPLTGKPTKVVGSFRIWWGKEGINGIEIVPFTKELEEFRKARGATRLGGIWKGLRITDEDIKEAREHLLQALEDRW